MKPFYILLATLCILFVVSGSATAKQLEVGTNCEYTDISTAINAASYGDIVNIHEGVYSGDKSLFAKSGLTIKGAGDNKTILYTDSLEDISTDHDAAMIMCNNVSSVEIYNITFLGAATSRDNQHDVGGTSAGGLREARNGIKIESSNDVTVHDCYYTLLISDGIRITGSENINVYNCRFESAGHDSISVFKSKKVNVDNCLMDEMINTCIRFDYASDCVVTNSMFTQVNDGTGGGYLELEHTISDITVSKCVFMDSSDSVFYIAYAEGGNILMKDNILHNVDLGDSGVYQVTDENNVKYIKDMNWAEMGYGYNAASAPTNVIKFVDDGIDQHTSETVVTNETCVETTSNCTAVNETNECEETICNTTITFMDSLSMKYMDFSITSEQSATNFTTGSASDLENAKLLLTGTVEEQELGMMYLNAHDLKLQYARDMLNMSQNSSDEIRKRMGA